MNENLYMGEVGLAELWNLMKEYVDGKVFIGTKEEYDAAYAAGAIAVGQLVIITDESDVVIPPIEEKPTSSIAILGTAVLGQCILG